MQQCGRHQAKTWSRGIGQHGPSRTSELLAVAREKGVGMREHLGTMGEEPGFCGGRLFLHRANRLRADARRKLWGEVIGPEQALVMTSVEEGAECTLRL